MRGRPTSTYPIWLFMGGMLLGIGTSHGQAYPSRPIRFVAMGQIGGGTDYVARLIAPELSRALGESVVVDNRAGKLCGGATDDFISTLVKCIRNLLLMKYLYDFSVEPVDDGRWCASWG